MECLSTLGRQVQRTIAAICTVLALHMNAPANRAVQPLLLVVHTRLNRLMWRLDRLALLWQQGRLPAPRAPRPKNAATPARPAPALRLPRGKSWLIHLVPFTGQFHAHVESLLHDPQVQALVAAAPQAGRLLRPLARMFGVDLPAHLRLPERPKPARPKAPRKPRAKHPLSGMTMQEIAAYLAPMPPHFPLYFRRRRIPNR